jgi:hypothetical protein
MWHVQGVARELRRKKDLLKNLGVRGEITLIWALKMCDRLA